VSDLDIHLASIASGDDRAFALWLAGAERRVLLSLSSFAGQVDVEVVVQEALLRVWQAAPRHQPDGKPDSLLRLAIRIARNLAIDETRKRRPDLVDDEILERLADAGVPPSREPDPLLRRALMHCLEDLGGRPAEVMHARLSAGGESDAALASKLGMAVNAFLQNVVRARKALLACLTKSGVNVEAEGLR
jgi:RNA polymerase sigma-70 factor (ECF subfamily)